MEIVRPHLLPLAPTARLGILIRALIVLVAGRWREQILGTALGRRVL
jgi:hypothetical protein